MSLEEGILRVVGYSISRLPEYTWVLYAGTLPGQYLYFNSWIEIHLPCKFENPDAGFDSRPG